MPGQVCVGGLSTQHLSDWRDILPTGKNISTTFIFLPWRHFFIPFWLLWFI